MGSDVRMLLLGGLWSGVILYAFYRNHDALSPSKFYLASLLLFFGDVFIGDYSLDVTMCFVGLIGVGVAYVEKEAQSLRFDEVRKNISRLRESHHRDSGQVRFNYDFVPCVIWLASLAPIGVQLLLINWVGGILLYLDAIKSRVVVFEGMGPAFTVLRILPILNLLYLAFVLTRPRLTLANVLPYCVHFAFLMLVGVLSGSRSAALYPILLAVITIHYVRRRFSVLFLVGLAASLFTAASVLGTIRETFKIDEDRFELNLHSRESIFMWSGFRYGLIGLETILADGVHHPKGGFTFLTLFTNFVPRSLWPGKPDSGGVVFTKEYLGDQWDGLSNATPGLLGEFMMNFGIPLGLMGGFACMLGLNWWTIQFYRRAISSRSSGRSGFERGFATVEYILVFMYTNGLLIGEFAYTTMGFIISLVFVKCIRIIVNAIVKKATLPNCGSAARFVSVCDKTRAYRSVCNTSDK